MRTNNRKGGALSGFGFAAQVALGGLLLFVGACQTTPRIAGRDTQVLSQGRLAALNPVDVAVAPVILASATMQAPLKQIRRGAQYGLTTRLYSPLSNDIVDQSIGGGVDARPFTPGTVSASYVPGDLGEDAVLEIYIERWDAANWEIRRSVDVAIEARMIDPKDPQGPELWAARLERKFDFTGSIETRTAGPKAVQSACNKIFRELMAKLPVRDTTPRVSPFSRPAGAGTQPASAPGTDSEGNSPAAREGSDPLLQPADQWDDTPVEEFEVEVSGSAQRR